MAELSQVRPVNLRAERLNRGFSTREAAVEIGVSEYTLARAESGSGIRPKHMKAIADFYKVLVTDIWPVEKAA